MPIVNGGEIAGIWVLARVTWRPAWCLEAWGMMFWEQARQNIQQVHVFNR